jgi:hypothetical protein
MDDTADMLYELHKRFMASLTEKERALFILCAERAALRRRGIRLTPLALDAAGSTKSGEQAIPAAQVKLGR